MDSEPGPSGRGTPQKGGRKLKFAPTMPGRRKKQEEDGLAALVPIDATAASETFKGLIQAAKSEAKWERGRGRGRGRGRALFARSTVAFGGAGGAAGGPSHVGAGQRVLHEGGQGFSAIDKIDLDGVREEKALVKKEKRPDSFLDHEQYYPTLLPLRPPTFEDLEGSQKPQLGGHQLAPQDLAVTMDEEEDTANELGLLDLDDSEDLFLFQLPPVLPIPVPPSKEAEAGAQARSKRGPVFPLGCGTTDPGALALKDVPSGLLGQLLVFESGAVKLKIGDVLFDVSCGMPCVTRQDVALLGADACVLLGDITKRAVVCPDINQLMDDTPVPSHYQDMKERQEVWGSGMLVENLEGISIKKEHGL